MHLNGDISVQGFLMWLVGMLIIGGGAFWRASRYFKGQEDRQKVAEGLIESRHAENRTELSAIKTSTAALEKRVEDKFDKFGDTITQMRMEQVKTEATVTSLASLVKDCWGVNQQVRALLDTATIKPKRNS